MPSEAPAHALPQCSPQSGVRLQSAVGCQTAVRSRVSDCSPQSGVRLQSAVGCQTAVRSRVSDCSPQSGVRLQSAVGCQTAVGSCELFDTIRQLRNESIVQLVSVEDQLIDSACLGLDRRPGSSVSLYCSPTRLTD